MADEKTFTQEQLDAAVAKATGDLDGLKAKIEEVIGENKKLKSDLRAKSELKPEDLAAAEDRAEKAEAALVAANKAAKEATTAAEKATKALETEQGAARSYALDAEINAAIAEGNVIPALVPAFSALLRKDAKVDLVDGKYSTVIGDKPAKEYVSSFLGTEEGKHFKGAAANSGGGASGGGNGTPGGKTMTRSAFDALPMDDRMTFSKEGGKVVDEAA